MYPTTRPMNAGRVGRCTRAGDRRCTAPEPRRIRRQSRRTNREAIPDAARKLFYERGYAGVAVNAITEARGYPAGFYTYFKDKREISATSCPSGPTATCGRCSRAGALPAGSSADDVRGFVRDYFVWTGTVRSPCRGAFRSRRRRLPRGIPAHADPGVVDSRQGLPGAGAHSPEVVGCGVRAARSVLAHRAGPVGDGE